MIEDTSRLIAEARAWLRNYRVHHEGNVPLADEAASLLTRLTVAQDALTQQVGMLQNTCKAVSRNANELNVTLNEHQDSHAAFVEQIRALRGKRAIEAEQMQIERDEFFAEESVEYGEATARIEQLEAEITGLDALLEAERKD